jgi:NAD(P)-dependent dehydrogenase (short-subunit alcohol dehydrogenase family)
MAGRSVVVTGGASGIGAACALRMAQEGAASVVVGDLDDARGDQVVAALRAAGAAAGFVRTDVTDAGACRALVDAGAATTGRVDVLVAAAGISHGQYRSGAESPSGYGADRSRAHLVDVDPADWHRVLDVNLHGLFHVLQATARRMLADGTAGSIVTVTSMKSQRASVATGPYSVSKAAAWMLTKTLALELAAHGIRVNAVGPGFIDTPMNTALKGDPAAVQRVVEATPLGRLGSPEEVASAVLYLAGDESAYLTGSALYPDGGFLAATR